MSDGAWPLKATVAVLGASNGAFAIAAIASMMRLAGEGRASREGVRMGLWGAVLPEDHAETARVALTLARLDVEVEGDALALGRAREAASRLGGSFGSSHFEAIRAELLVADLALATGDLEQAAARVGPAWEKMVRENMANGPILAEALLIEADLAWRAGDATRARRLLEQIRGAAGHPLDGPWVCPRFAAPAALVGAPGVRCPDLPIAPRSETARLRGALAGAQK